MQAKVEPMTDVIPDVLKQLIWDPAIPADALPVNATEVALVQLIDDKQRVRSVNFVNKFIQVLQRAKTEADEALVLVILRATATSSDSKLSKTCTAAFEKCGGLKIAKRWLDEAVEWNYSDLLVLLLDVLKVLPVQLASITEARINEPIVKLRKTAQEEKVRRAAQDLLKHWRARFTEKEKERNKTSSSTGSSTSVTSDVPKTEVKSVSAPTPTPAAAPASSSKPVAEAPHKELKAQKKSRPIKFLERPPSSAASSSTSKSSELIGNLMQRKSAKDAAKSTKDSSPDNKQSSNDSSSKQIASETSTETSAKEDVLMQLPAIQSFKTVATTSVSKKIRWADEEGKELVKVKLIESWRDMIHHSPHDENSFKDAKLREHEAERMAMKSHKEREAFHVVIAHEWTTPALFMLPEALASRREAVKTEEVETQSARTRREMEFLVLDGEVPPLSPKEWTRTNEPHRGAPKEIPLSDVDSAPAGATAPASSAVDPGETKEERALRDALGPLHRNTIALLMENEHVLPMVYEEAQRNGNHISDGRVMEIVDYHRHQGHPQQYHQPHQGPPPMGQRFGSQPPPGSYDGGYSKYGGGGGYHNGPPPVGGAPPGYDYNRQYGPPPHGQQPPMHHQSLKRKAPGGVLADGPPAKRMGKRGSPCMYFASPAGCRHGASCQFAHEVVGGPPPPHMGGGGPGMPADYGNAYGPPMGGRFGGHQAPMGMRGGGGMRGMRGGR